MSKALVLNLGLLRNFGLQFPKAFTTSCPDWGFWEMQFKSIQVTKVKNHWSKAACNAPGYGFNKTPVKAWRER